MNKLLAFSLIILGLGMYLMLINFLASLPIQSTGSTETHKEFGSGGVRVGVGESVSVRVDRPRWYGKIVETSSPAGKISYLYFLNFLKIPLQSNDLNFFYFHAITLILGIFFVVRLFRSKEKREGKMNLRRILLIIVIAVIFYIVSNDGSEAFMLLLVLLYLEFLLKRKLK